MVERAELDAFRFRGTRPTGLRPGSVIFRDGIAVGLLVTNKPIDALRAWDWSGDEITLLSVGFAQG